eukprot:TRINITY_DN2838_c0_g1_i1.p1 TRINITY_DN2838_c0_g1~~TRINITY_DN2838_c0_g1_i1.p1  ORF type:complete len:386 (-),score=138.96 TRINITY_DN2838_c0_g1_i1:240-1349(-)
MNQEINADNPYSRLIALQKMGIVKNYEIIREKTIAVVGIGGIGSVAAEMLVRCGVGKLILFDYDKVEMANMNRLLFRPCHVGMTKSDAATETFKEINPDVEYVSVHGNIAVGEGYDTLCSLVGTGGLQGNKIDMLLCCVDNYEARIAINRCCMDNDVVWYESGVSESAMSGHIQLVKPGLTPCFECSPPLLVVEGNEKNIKREGVCAASLSTTMGIVAGLMVNNVLKFLLGFGMVSPYVGYNVLSDFFPSIEMKPNVDCEVCKELQRGYIERNVNIDSYLQGIQVAVEETEVEIIDNEWDIEISAEGDNLEENLIQSGQDSVNGLKFGFMKEKEEILDAHQKEEINQLNENSIFDENFDDLLAEFQNLQ